ncbi:hypothetical protein V5O48_012080 [Marasmius crinis-equi]|uniref:Uncharacterized protein n=1 Tax=Marasmius crinis-equi TaxID=585013 RepID=A0ABR3F3S4_9AGAR
MPDQQDKCAVNPDGSLKDVSKIDFAYSATKDVNEPQPASRQVEKKKRKRTKRSNPPPQEASTRHQNQSAQACGDDPFPTVVTQPPKTTSCKRSERDNGQAMQAGDDTGPNDGSAPVQR